MPSSERSFVEHPASSAALVDKGGSYTTSSKSDAREVLRKCVEPAVVWFGLRGPGFVVLRSDRPQPFAHAGIVLPEATQ